MGEFGIDLGEIKASTLGDITRDGESGESSVRTIFSTAALPFLEEGGVIFPGGVVVPTAVLVCVGVTGVGVGIRGGVCTSKGGGVDVRVGDVDAFKAPAFGGVTVPLDFFRCCTNFTFLSLSDPLFDLVRGFRFLLLGGSDDRLSDFS